MVQLQEDDTDLETEDEKRPPLAVLEVAPMLSGGPLKMSELEFYMDECQVKKKMTSCADLMQDQALKMALMF